VPVETSEPLQSIVLTQDELDTLRKLQPGVWTREAGVGVESAPPGKTDISSLATRIVIDNPIWTVITQIIKMMEATITKGSTGQPTANLDDKPSLIVRHLAAMAGVSVEKVTPQFIEEMVAASIAADNKEAEQRGFKTVTSGDLRRRRQAPFPRLS
jgi:hypothetical protein